MVSVLENIQTGMASTAGAYPFSARKSNWLPWNDPGPLVDGLGGILGARRRSCGGPVTFTGVSSSGNEMESALGSALGMAMGIASGNGDAWMRQTEAERTSNGRNMFCRMRKTGTWIVERKIVDELIVCSTAYQDTIERDLCVL